MSLGQNPAPQDPQPGRAPQQPTPEQPARPVDPAAQPTETLYPSQAPTAVQPGVPPAQGQGWGGPGQHPAPGAQPAQGWAAPGSNAAPGWGAPSSARPQGQGYGPGYGAPGQGWGAPGSPASGQGWGQQPPAAPKKGRLARLTPVQKGLAAAGVAVVVVGGAGAAVYAATTAVNNAANDNAGGQGLGGPGAGQNAPGQNGPGQNGLRQGGGFGPGNLGLGAAGQAVHGEYVVQRNGQYVTELEQTGTITAVSASQMTVKSPDGYVQTYAISSQTTIASFGARGTRQQGQSQGQSQSQGQGSLTASSLATGQSVRVTALKDGNAALTILVESAASSSGSSTPGATGQSN
ncbi:hypothetical protein SPF06_16665 [Sinomonas sp. JGH33]|uniref:DUF5666 domain-containing protein n=1 Tax=Sinomonas terricola TaxID=3110330 RepID=A0ABU5T9V8_9MICC|nr:hypothetical protein [Sinomonas sp. JGH33]MEA5456368.1 hypothetical protein [Sinomonas sp. JGH33]